MASPFDPSSKMKTPRSLLIGIVLATAALSSLSADPFRDLSSDDLTRRLAAQESLQTRANAVTAPGAAPTERVEFERQLLDRIGPDKPTQERTWTLRMLRFVGGPAALDPLVAQLDSTDPVIANEALEALAANPDPTATARIARALKAADDPSAWIQALAWRGDDSAVPAIVPFLTTEDPAAKAAAAQALARLGGADAIEAVRSAIAREPANPDFQAALLALSPDLAELTQLVGEGANAGIRAGAFAQLLSRDLAAASTAFATALGDRTFAGRTAIIHSAMSVEATRTILLDQLPDLDPSAQIVIVAALAIHPDTTAKSALIALLESPNAGVQIAALRTLGRIGREASLPAIAARLDSKDRDVVDAAAEALARLDPVVDDQLRDQVTAKDETTRIAAVRALGLRNPRGAEAILTTQLDTNAPGEFQTALLESLAQIGGTNSAADLARLVVSGKDSASRRPAQLALKRLAVRLDQPASLWTTAFQPALAAAATDNDRGALIVVMDSVPAPEALAYLTEKARSDTPELRSPALKALAAWPNYDAASFWLERLAAENSDPTGAAQALQALSRLIGSSAMPRGMPNGAARRVKLVGDALAAASDSQRLTILRACEKIKFKYRDGLNELLIPFLDNPELGPTARGLMKDK